MVGRADPNIYTTIEQANKRIYEIVKTYRNETRTYIPNNYASLLQTKCFKYVTNTKL